MKLSLAFVAVLVLTVPLSAQQNAHAEPIPTTYPDAHGEQLPNAVVPIAIQTATSTSGKLLQPDQEDLPLRIPLLGQMDQHVQPIPNWKEPVSSSQTVTDMHACVILEDNGKDYTYVEGMALGGVRTAKQFADSDIHEVIAAGGWVKILKHGYSADDLARERKGCMEGSTTIALPPPAGKP